jgi:peptidyl-tRNA hydrolase
MLANPGRAPLCRLLSPNEVSMVYSFNIKDALKDRKHKMRVAKESEAAKKVDDGGKECDSRDRRYMNRSGQRAQAIWRVYR